MDIEKVISGCKANNRVAQEEVYRKFFPIMMSMCMRYVDDKEKAASIVNEGLLKVYTKIDSFEFKGSFEGWIRRIVFRCLSDNIRKDANYMKFMVFDEYEGIKTNHLLSSLYEEDILSLLDKIPPTSGQVFVLYAIQGYSHKEIAALKNISVGTSKWHLSEARKRLQQLILNEGNYNAG